jgi:hypothetical protein
MGYTDEERKLMREAIDYLKSVEDDIKGKKELRGGAFPLLALLFGLIKTAAITAARVAPRVVGRVAATGARAVGRVLPKASGRVSRTPVTPRATGRLLTLGSLGASGMGGIVDKPTEPDVVDDPNVPRFRETLIPTAGVDIGDITEDNVDEEVEGEETAQPFNITPIRFNPRIRNVFRVGESRNPLQTGQFSQLLLARRTPATTTTTRSTRDISRLTGLGVTQRMRVLKKYGLEDKPYSITELAKITGVPRKTLQEVYNRGIGAYKTSPTSVRMKRSFKKNVDAPMSQKLSKEQWAFSRVYSFLAGNKKHDNDLRD